MCRKVLVVDEEAAVRRQLSTAMEQQGYQTRESADGLNALKMLDQEARTGCPFSAVVTDVMLPDISGLKLLSVIKGRFPKIKVIVISGEARDDMTEQVQERHGDGYLSRPFGIDRITRLLDGTRPGKVDSTDVEAAYILIKLDKTAEPWKVFDALVKSRNTRYCDPIRDSRYDIVVSLKGPEAVREMKKVLQALPGIAQWEMMPVKPLGLRDDIQTFIDRYLELNEINPDSARKNLRATSYLLIDLNPAELSNLYVRLYFLDEVVGIDPAESCDRLMVLVQGEDFGQIRRTINNRIRLLDGILRVHEMKVVQTDQR